MARKGWVAYVVIRVDFNCLWWLVGVVCRPLFLAFKEKMAL